MSQFEEISEENLNYWGKISNSFQLFDHKAFDQSVSTDFNDSKRDSNCLEITVEKSTSNNELKQHCPVHQDTNWKPKSVSVELVGNEKNSKECENAKSFLFTADFNRDKNDLCQKSLTEHCSDSKLDTLSLDFNIRIRLSGEIVSKNLTKDVPCKCKHKEDQLKQNQYKFKNFKFNKPCSVVLHDILLFENKNCSLCKKQTRIDPEIRFKKPYKNAFSFATSKVFLKNSKFQNKKPFFRKPELKLHRIEDTIAFCKTLNLKPGWRNDSLWKSPVQLSTPSKIRRCKRE